MAVPATFSSLKTAVIAKLRMDATADDAKVGDWLVETLDELVGETSSFQASASTTLTAGTTTYAFPSGAFSLIAVTSTPVDQTQPSRTLEVVSLPQLLDMRQGATGTPYHYALAGEGFIEVSPAPSAADTLTFWYTKLPAVMSASATNPPVIPRSFAKALEYGALVQGAEFKKDPLLDYFQAQKDVWFAKYRVHMRRQSGGVARSIPIHRQTPIPHSRSQDFGNW